MVLHIMHICTLIFMIFLVVGGTESDVLVPAPCHLGGCVACLEETELSQSVRQCSLVWSSTHEVFDSKER